MEFLPDITPVGDGRPKLVQLMDEYDEKAIYGDLHDPALAEKELRSPLLWSHHWQVLRADLSVGRFTAARMA